MASARRSSDAGEALRDGLEALFRAAGEALDQGATLLILSDAGSGGDNLLPIPSLLAASALHNHLIRARKRHLCGLISENGDAWEPMHHGPAHRLRHGRRLPVGSAG